MNTNEFKRPVTIQDAIKEIERELSVRRRVYPDWVKIGRIKQAVANNRLGTCSIDNEEISEPRTNNTFLNQ